MKLSFKISYIIAVFLAILCSCSNKKADTIRIGVLNGPSAVSFIQLIDKNITIDGKKLEIIVKNEPQQIQAMMMQGQLDFAILPTLMAANLYNKGVPYQMVACPIWGTLYILSNDNITQLGELKNHSISVLGQGATPDVLLMRMLHKKGVLNVKLDYNYSTHADVAQALLMHKTKIAVISEPMVSNLLSKDSTIHIIAKLTCEDNINENDSDIFVQTAFLVSERFTSDNRTIVPKVCEAYAVACQFISQKPKEAAKLMVQHKFSTNISVALHSIPLCNIHYISAYSIRKQINRYLNIFYQFDPKSIGGKVPNNAFVYNP